MTFFHGTVPLIFIHDASPLAPFNKSRISAEVVEPPPE